MTFLDPPKSDAKAVLQQLMELGVAVKVLTGQFCLRMLLAYTIER